MFGDLTIPVISYCYIVIILSLIAITSATAALDTNMHLRFITLGSDKTV